MERRQFVVDKVRHRRNDEEVVLEREAAFLVKLHAAAKVREADPHLSDKWLQAVEDLRELWAWDWRPLRPTSPFELAVPKFVYTPGYPISDVLRGYHGEERWRWNWLEDGAGNLHIRNQCWCSGNAKICISQEEVTYDGIQGEHVTFGPMCAWHQRDAPQAFAQDA
mmetsp:Transcript_91646/g.142995  ORF Transcript_91646/g.142995 Transcript_91646/m.142995 type:complete len:166 (+) Transcript_91646:2-499(+)